MLPSAATPRSTEQVHLVNEEDNIAMFSGL